MQAGTLAHMGWGLLLVVAGCSGDDTSGDPTEGSEVSGAPASSDGVGDESPAASESTSAGDSSDGATTETAEPPSGLDGILGEWASIDSFDPDRPDLLDVRPDATATGIFRYLVDGNPWEVRLEATVAAVDGKFDFAFRCDDPTPACVALEFDTRCELLLERLICPAPEWFYQPEIVFERVPM
jgi:hypothetical protein